MKKHQTTFLALLMAAAIAAPLGCGKSNSGDGYGGVAAAIDLSKIEGAFASATGVIKSEWDKVAASIKSADYSGALASLQTLAKDVGLSEEQKTAVSDLLKQVKAKAGDFVKGATEAVSKVADEAAAAAARATDAAKSPTPK